MGLETASFVSGLNTAWPLAGDTKSQGDDHLRLIKSVLTASFPNASKAFYIPSAEASTIAMVLDATDQNNLIGIDTTAGDIAVTLPTLAAGDKGWSCEIYRSNSGTFNGIVVSPASGTINSVVGATATIRIERVFEPCRFMWSGTYWIAHKPGPMVGSSMNWDGSVVPSGYRVADGTAYSTTTFAELNAALGTATLRDKRGRSEVGLDASNVNMSSTAWGGAVTLGTTKAGGAITLLTANLPAYTPSGTGTASVDTDNYTAWTTSNVSGSAGAGGSQLTVPGSPGGQFGKMHSAGTISFTGTAQGGTSTPFSIVGPSIATNKLVRVA
jgi:hypothetical protein